MLRKQKKSSYFFLQNVLVESGLSSEVPGKGRGKEKSFRVANPGAISAVVKLALKFY